MIRTYHLTHFDSSALKTKVYGHASVAAMYNNNGHIRTVGGDGGDVADPASSNTTVISTNGTRSRADSRDQQPLQAFERLASTSVRKVLGSQTSLAAARKLVATKAQQLMACIVYGGLSVFTSLLIKVRHRVPLDTPHKAKLLPQHTPNIWYNHHTQHAITPPVCRQSCPSTHSISHSL